MHLSVSCCPESRYLGCTGGSMSFFGDAADIADQVERKFDWAHRSWLLDRADHRREYERERAFIAPLLVALRSPDPLAAVLAEYPVRRWVRLETDAELAARMDKVRLRCAATY